MMKDKYPSCFDCTFIAARRKDCRILKRRRLMCRLTGEDTRATADCNSLTLAGIQKSPLTQGGGSGQGNTGQEQDTLHGSDAQAERKGLLFLPDSVKLDSPLNHSKDISAKITPATGVTILAGQRPGTCEGPAAYYGPGSVDPAISFNPFQSIGGSYA